MNGFGWLPDQAAPQTTAQAVPVAVTNALKGLEMAPFPRTEMAISGTAFAGIVGVAEDALRGTGLPYTKKQLVAELTSRGYRLRDGLGGFGQGAVVQAGMTGREAAMQQRRASARGEMLRSKAVLIGIALVGTVVVVLAIRSERKKGR